MRLLQPDTGEIFTQTLQETPVFTDRGKKDFYKLVLKKRCNVYVFLSLFKRTRAWNGAAALRKSAQQSTVGPQTRQWERGASATGAETG